MSRVLTIDVSGITEDEAVEHFIHHAMLACAYFEATPHDENSAIEHELFRLKDRLNDRKDHISKFAALLYAYHEKLKQEQGE